MKRVHQQEQPFAHDLRIYEVVARARARAVSVATMAGIVGFVLGAEGRRSHKQASHFAHTNTFILYSYTSWFSRERRAIASRMRRKKCGNVARLVPLLCPSAGFARQGVASSVGLAAVGSFGTPRGLAGPGKPPTNARRENPARTLALARMLTCKTERKRSRENLFAGSNTHGVGSFASVQATVDIANSGRAFNGEQ